MSLNGWLWACGGLARRGCEESAAPAQRKEGDLSRFYRAGGPSPFGPGVWFCGRRFFHGVGRGVRDRRRSLGGNASGIQGPGGGRLGALGIMTSFCPVFLELKSQDFFNFL